MGKMLEKTLELTFHIGQDNFEIEVYEPESEECEDYKFGYSQLPSDFKQVINSKTFSDITQVIGVELFSWICLWRDELEQEDS